MEHKAILSSILESIQQLEGARALVRSSFVLQCRKEGLSDDDICWRMAEEDFPEREFNSIVHLFLFGDKPLVERERLGRITKQMVYRKRMDGKQ